MKITMEATSNFKSLIRFGILAAAVLITLAVFSSAKAALPEGATQDQVNAALSDLSQAVGQTVATVDQASTICDSAQYFETCADIGKKHNLYESSEIKQVDAFISEVKGQVVQQLQSCQTTECLINVANDLAKKITAKTPAVAAQLELTPALVEKRGAITKAAKEIGVSFDDCQKMNPETAPVELLRACARLAKDSRVQEYIPQATRNTLEFSTDGMVALREGLASGAISCGGTGNLEACGNYCLNPSAETRVQGTGAIPQNCRQIAQKFFGPEGVKQLELAYQQVGQAREYYFKKAEFAVFTTADGTTLTTPEAIGGYLETSMQQGCVECVDRGMEFMATQGLVKPSDAEFAKKMVRKIKDSGGQADFGACVQDPKACQNFVPEENRADFQTFGQLEQIMRQELGFDPKECERGESDPNIGLKCLEGSKRALPKLEALAASSPQVKAIVEDIKGHIARGDDLTNKKDQFNQVFQTQGGPGGCRSPQECSAYCSDTAHGPECIAFGAQQGIAGFKGQEAVQRYQQFNQDLQGPRYEPPGFEGGFPGRGPYPGFIPPGQPPGFTQPGPGFSPPPGFGGPGPECIAALQSGDFNKARVVCQVATPPPGFGICPAIAPIECRAGTYRREFVGNNNCPSSECVAIPTYTSTGQPQQYCPPPSYWDPSINTCRASVGGGVTYPYVFTDGKSVSNYEEARGYCYQYGPSSGRGIAGECETKFGIFYGSPTYTPYSSQCSALGDYHEMSGYCMSNTDGSKCVTYSGSATSCGAYPTYSSYPSYTPYSNQCSNLGNYHDMGGFCMSNIDGSKCVTYSGSTTSCGSYPTYTPYPTLSYSPGPTYSSGPGGSSCSQSLIGLLGSGCHQMYTDPSSGRTIYCDGPMTKSAKEGDTTTTLGCSSGTASSPYPTYSPPTSSGNCPSGAHIMYVNNAGGYCMSDADTAKCGPLNSTSVSNFGSCSTYQGGGTTYTPYPSYSSYPTYTPYPSYTPYPTYSSYPSYTPYSNQCSNLGNYHDMGGFCMSNIDGSKCVTYSGSTTSCGSYPTYTPYPTTQYTAYPTTQYTAPPSCPSGQYWNGSACANSSTPVPTQDPAAACSQTGGTWNGSSCVFPTPAPTQNPPPSSFDYYQHNLAVHNSTAHRMALANTIMACADDDGRWDARSNSCRLTAKSFFANIFRPIINFFK